MGRKANDGRGRLGGRKKGTPNKATNGLREWITNLLDDKREEFEEDLESLDPSERVKVLSGLFNYVVPKKQSLSVEQEIQNETEVLTRLLSEAPEETVNLIATKVLELQEANKRRVSNGTE